MAAAFMRGGNSVTWILISFCESCVIGYHHDAYPNSKTFKRNWLVKKAILSHRINQVSHYEHKWIRRELRLPLILAVHHCLVALLLERWRQGDRQTMPARYSLGDSNVTACMRLPPLITHLGHRDMIRAGAVPPSLLTPTVHCLNLSFPLKSSVRVWRVFKLSDLYK